jgi:hypothetical protein
MTLPPSTHICRERATSASGDASGGRPQVREDLRQRGQIGAAVRGLSEEPLGESDVRLDVFPRTHLT